MHACVCLVVESVIDLFREEAGISGLREGSVEERKREERRMGEGERERKRERGNLSLSLSLFLGGEKGEERKEEKETTRRWTDGRVVTTPARALGTRRSGLPDGQRTNDRVLLRLPRLNYPKKEKERKRERGKIIVSRGEVLSLLSVI